MVGATWRRFTLFAVLGELVWVGLYMALGFAFSRSIVAIADLTGDLAWFLVAAAAALVFGLALRRQAGRRRAARSGG
jgi:membrane-associated protein